MISFNLLQTKIGESSSVARTEESSMERGKNSLKLTINVERSSNRYCITFSFTLLSCHLLYETEGESANLAWSTVSITQQLL